MAISAVVWEALRIGCIKYLKGRKLSDEVSKELAVSLLGTVHAIVACALSIKVIATEPVPDSVYHRIDLSQTTFAVSAGYFAWDIYYVLLRDEKLDVAFAIHAVSCFFCYLFGQYPFLNYWGVYFLLFELSTPFMHARKALLLLGRKDSLWFPKIEAAFGASFAFARILVGIPMSALVWRDLLSLLNTPEKVHSAIVVYYYLVANTALCGLNMFWFWGMMKKRFSTKGKSS